MTSVIDADQGMLVVDSDEADVVMKTERNSEKMQCVENFLEFALVFRASTAPKRL